MPFIDHFGGHADAYQRHRPDYPPSLFDCIREHSPRLGVAWDAGTGGGQAAVVLESCFDHVIGTDASFDQLRAGSRRAVVASAAEAPPLADSSVDVVTVAQALHWFDLDRFYAAVRRVVRRPGLIAAWSYGMPSVSPAIDRSIRHFHDQVVGRFWPARRRHVIRGYRDLDFPFPPIVAPDLEVEARWNLEGLRGYLATWSAAQRFVRATGDDPLGSIETPLASAWGDVQASRVVRWPLTLLLGRIE